MFHFLIWGAVTGVSTYVCWDPQEQPTFVCWDSQEQPTFSDSLGGGMVPTAQDSRPASKGKGQME